MADEELDILIRISADLSGADEAKRALEATAAGNLQVASATSKATEASGDAEKHTLKLGDAHDALHKAMHLVTEESPILGLAVQAAFNPIGAAIGAVILGFKQFNDHIKESNELMDRMQEASAQSIGNMKESMREANAEIALHNLEYQNWLTNLKTLSGEVTQQLNDQLAQIKVNTEADRNLQLARVEAMRAAGQVTDADAVRRTAFINSTYQSDQTQAENVARERALAKLKGRETEAQEASDKADAEAHDPKRAGMIKDVPKQLNAVKMANERADWPSQIAAAQKEYDEQEEQYKKEKENLDRAAKAHALPLSDEAFEREVLKQHDKQKQEAYDKWQGLIAQQNQGKKDIEDGQQKLDKLNQEQKQADLNAGDKKKALEDVQNQIKQVEDAIKAAKIAQSVRPQQQETERLKNLGTIRQTPQGGEAFAGVQEAVLTAQLLSNPKTAGQATPEMQNELLAVASTIAGKQVALDQAVQMMNWAGQNQNNFATTVNRLVDRIIEYTNLAARQTDTRVMAELNRRIVTLESQINNLKPMLPGGG